MIFEFTNYRDILQHELEKRQNLNPRFSMRAMAGKLGVSAPALSEVLNGKRGLSKMKANTIASRLTFNSIETDYFVSLVEASDGNSKRVRSLAQNRVNKFKTLREKPIHHDTWQVISEWHHVAILELSRTVDFKSSPRWIAARLDIEMSVVKQAIERLLRLGILRSTANPTAKFEATGQWLLTSPNEIPSSCIRKFHSTILKKAHAALESQPIAKRNFSSLLLAIEEKDIEVAKTLIGEFNRKMSQLLTKGDRRTRVYCFSTQFFPMDTDT